MYLFHLFFVLIQLQERVVLNSQAIIMIVFQFKRKFKHRWYFPFVLGFLCYFSVVSASVEVTPPSHPNTPLSISSDELLSWQSPLSLNINYSDELGAMYAAKWLHALGSSNAISLTGTLGPREQRYSLTWGYVLTAKQRLKLTYEYLSQKLGFDFASGSIKHWVGQNAGGIAYQWMFSSPWLKSLEIQGYYAKANSLSLPTLIFDGGQELNLRRIAGATSRGMRIGSAVSLWRNSLLKVDLDYDDVDYPMHYESGPSASGLGESVVLKQLLSQHLRLIISQSHRKIYDRYAGEFDWLIPTKKNFGIELSLLGHHVHSHTALGNENRIGIRVACYWKTKDAKNTVYILPSNAALGNIRDWVGTPAVHMDQVLAVRDQAVTKRVFSKSALPLKSATRMRLIQVHPGERVDLAIGQYRLGGDTDQLEKLGLKINAKSHDIVGVIPKTVQPKDYRFRLRKLMPLKSSISHAYRIRNVAQRHVQPVIVFRVLKNPNAPQIKQPIPNVSQLFSNPTVNIVLRKDEYFTNPWPASPMLLTITGLPSNLTVHKTGSDKEPYQAYTISGTANQENVIHGSYTITVTAQNDYGKISQNFTLTIEPTLPIYHGPASLPVDTETKAYDYNLAADFVGKNLQINVQGLPVGLTYQNGHIIGTPTQAGSYPLTVSAQNSYGTIHPSMTMSILAAPRYHGATYLTGGIVNQVYQVNLSQQFTPADVVVRTDDLPPGLTYDVSTKTISGTPTQAGDYTLNLTASANNVSIKPTIKIGILGYHGPVELPSGATGELYQPPQGYNLASQFSGSDVQVQVDSSTLPAGLSFNPNTGYIAGTPSEEATGQYMVSVTATAAGVSLQKSLGLKIKGAPHYVGPAVLPAGITSQNYHENLTHDFTPGDVVVSINNLPPGLTFDAATKTISGRPTTPGDYVLTTTASVGGQQIHPKISMGVMGYHGPVNLPEGRVGRRFSYNFKSQFSPSSVQLSVDPQTLPPGLTYVNGVIQGVPSKVGDYQLGVVAEYQGSNYHPQITLPIKNRLVGHLACPDSFARPAKMSSNDGVRTYTFTGAKSIAGKRWLESSLVGKVFSCKYSFNRRAFAVTIHTTIQAKVSGSSSCSGGRMNPRCMATIDYT